MSNNIITLVGRVGSALQLTTTPTGKKVAKLSLGVKEYVPDGDDATMWITVELWNGLSERAMQVISKGREIVITGRLVLQKYSKQLGDTELTMTKAFVRANNFHLCGPKPASADATSSDAASDQSAEVPSSPSESFSPQPAC